MIDGTKINIRNPKFSSSDNSLITCEIEHEEYGWIGFLANPTDVMPYSKDIFNRALALNPTAYVEPPPAIPSVVTPYQARVALLTAGYMPQVEALMADPNVDPNAKIAWEYASGFYRDSPFISTLGAALGLTSEQIDVLFIAASQVV
jgi:hypothetical protein